MLQVSKQARGCRKLCLQLGQTAPNPILTTMRSFPELYEARLARVSFEPLVTLHDALREAVEIQGREPVPQEA